MAVGDRNMPRLRALSVVDDVDRTVVGDPLSGVFVAVPPVGGVVVRALQAGSSLAEAEAEAQRFAGQPVDVATFIERLAAAGLGAGSCGGDGQPRRTAAIQLRRWLHGPRAAQVRWLFGRTAWALYALLATFDAVVLLVRPALFPRPRAAYELLPAGAGPSLVALFPLATALTAVHECGHWLAARAAGVAARFGVDHRMYFLVFETDLTQLWALPRRRRFGPLLAGLAVDATVLAFLLAVELGAASRWWALPDVLARLAAALAFTELASMAWQCLLFLRTDLYAVLATATGCHNLWRVKTLSLRRALRILTPAQATELSTASRRDLAVAGWFRWIWLAGFLAAAAWFAWFYLPLLAHFVAWIGPGLVTGPLNGRFWLTAACAAILAWRYGAPAAFSLRAVTRKARSSRPEREDSGSPSGNVTG